MLSFGVEVLIIEVIWEEEVFELVFIIVEMEVGVFEINKNVVNGFFFKKKKKSSLKKCLKFKKDSDKKDEDEFVDEIMILDFREEFEKIAFEMGLVRDEVVSVCEEVEFVLVVKKNKKRKRENKGVVVE